MSFKRCPKCDTDQPFSNFYKSKTTRSAHGLQSYCKDCNRIHSRLNPQKNSKAEQGRKRVAEYKLAKGCVDCGYNKASEALDFDHLSDKSFGISYGVALDWETLLKEINKCEVVCANCHRIRTRKRANNVVQVS